MTYNRRRTRNRRRRSGSSGISPSTKTRAWRRIRKRKTRIHPRNPAYRRHVAEPEPVTKSLAVTVTESVTVAKPVTVTVTEGRYTHRSDDGRRNRHHRRGNGDHGGRGDRRLDIKRFYDYGGSETGGTNTGGTNTGGTNTAARTPGELSGGAV
jgi:hypothetical protein